MDSKRQIKLGAIMSYIAITVNILAGLLYTPWMIRTIGQNNYGLYTLATSLISIFLLDFGMSAAVSRFISKYNAEGDQESVNNFMGIVYKLYLIIDSIVLIALVVVFFFVDIIYIELTPAELSSFKVVYIIAATFSVISFPFITLNGVLSSYEKFIELKACDLFNRVASVILIVIALLFGSGLYALVTINAICGLAAILIKLIIIKRKTPVKVNFKYSSKLMLKDIFSFSAWSTVSSIAQRLIFNITPSILGVVSGSASIALFGIASTLEGYVFTFANAINGLFLPKVSRIVAGDEKHENILPLMIKVGRIQLIIIGLIVVGFISLGHEFIILWMGSEYIVSYYCSIALILPSLITVPQEIAYLTIVAVNKIKLHSLVTVSAGILNFGLSVVFSRFWGAFGASLSICIAYFVRTVAMNVIYYKALHIDVYRFFRECHIKLLLPLLITLVSGMAFHFIIPVAGWSGFIVRVILVTIVYVICLWYFSLNKFERSLFLEIWVKAIDLFRKIQIRLKGGIT